MELQLRLALPTMLITTPTAIKSPLLVDLNSSSEQSDASTGFYGSPISTHRRISRSSNSNKRSSDEDEFADQSDSASTDHTLPLLLCNKDEGYDCLNSGHLSPIRNGEEETEEVMGRPPIKSRRQRQRGGAGGLFVKAQMEGVVITRKIDLSLHQSYQTLLSTLLFMFGRGQESINEYQLTYLDMDGDWLFAADVPWRTFVESVRRIKLQKNED
ncbi:hypothetical protein V2J09_018746 [Rumex salicifolius]